MTRGLIDFRNLQFFMGTPSARVFYITSNPDGGKSVTAALPRGGSVHRDLRGHPCNRKAEPRR